VRYSIEEYNGDGFLKAPNWLWFGWFFLAKAWIVFFVAAASRDSGSKLLEIIYPAHLTLYLGLVVGFPAIVLIWLLGLRKPERQKICVLFSHGKWITALTIWAQLLLISYQIYLDNVQFNWVNAMTLLGLLWLMLYVLISRRVRDCFRSPLLN